MKYQTIIMLLAFAGILSCTKQPVNLNEVPGKTSTTSIQPLSSIDAPVHEELLNELIGFGSPTTGGQGGPLYVVTSLADSGPGTLREALTTSSTPLWIRFGVSGTITLASPIEPESNKTIDGRGADITITGYGIYLQGGKENLIVNNIKITNTAEDALRLFNGSNKMWVHHCSISNGGDGAFDATENVTDVTISYTHIFDHNKAMLIGASSDDGNGANLRWTAHHNWYQNAVQRLPILNKGKAHSFNNLYNWRSGTAIESNNAESQFYSENDIFEPLTNASHKLLSIRGGSTKFEGYWAKPYPGSTFNMRDTGTVFNPSTYYTYIADTANATLESHIEATAGWQNAPWPNLLVNASIEDGFTSWDAIWGSNTEINTNPLHAYSGSKSFKLHTSDGGRGQILTSGFTPGKSYTFSAYCKVSDPGTYGILEVQHLNSAGAKLSDIESSRIQSTTFQKKTMSNVVPIGTTTIKVLVYSIPGTDTVYADDFEFKED